jgi:hypothetical protein
MLEDVPNQSGSKTEIRAYLGEAEKYIQQAVALGNPKALRFIEICRELLDTL